MLATNRGIVLQISVGKAMPWQVVRSSKVMSSNPRSVKDFFSLNLLKYYAILYELLVLEFVHHGISVSCLMFEFSCVYVADVSQI